MKYTKRLLSLMLTVLLISCMFGNIRAEATETSAPKITVKYVNSKTGVKITIGKTSGAEGYRIYLKGYGDSYANYWSDDAKNDWHIVGFLEKGGRSKRTYTIKGLPKGTYAIKVAAVQKVKKYDTDFYEEISYSVKKNIKIKAPKKVSRQINTYDFSETKVGDTITFGTYEQDDIMTNGKEDIEWIVLSKTKSQMLVISKYALDCLPYNTEDTAITWKDSTLRKWLNNSFYKAAFTKAERSMIKKTKIKNADNVEFDIDGGSDTKDNVFLLSLDDVLNTEYGFSNEIMEFDRARRCAPTAYAVANGTGEAILNDLINNSTESTCFWWLRSPGYKANYAVYMVYDGSVNDLGGCINTEYAGVRPALVIDLTP